MLGISLPPSRLLHNVCTGVQAGIIYHMVECIYNGCSEGHIVHRDPPLLMRDSDGSALSQGCTAAHCLWLRTTGDSLCCRPALCLEGTPAAI